MAVAALPAPFVSAAGGTKLVSRLASAASPRVAIVVADCPAPPPPSPEHDAIDISAAADTQPIIVDREDVQPTSPQPEHAGIDIPAADAKRRVGGGKNPTRAGGFVRKLVKGLCVADIDGRAGAGRGRADLGPVPFRAAHGFLRRRVHGRDVPRPGS